MSSRWPRSPRSSKSTDFDERATAAWRSGVGAPGRGPTINCMEGNSVVSDEVVARDARDAALEVPGVLRVVDGVRKGVRVADGGVTLHLALAEDVSIPAVGAAVQRGVADF